VRNIILLGLTSLLADFSSEMVVPILPFFIQAVGGGGIAIGLIFGVGDAVAALLKVFSGYWADRTRKYKLFVFGGYLFSAAAKFLYPFANSWSQVSAIRPIERMGKGFRDAPRDAIVSESVPHERRGWGFGVQRAMDSVGALAGSVFVFVLFLYLDFPFQKIFFVSALVALLAVIPIFFVKVPAELRLNHRKKVSFEKLSSEAKRFIMIATLFAFSNFSVAFFVLKAQLSFTDLSQRQALAIALVVYIIFNIFDAGFSRPAGALSDRVGRKKIIFTSYLIFSAVSLGFLVLSLNSPALPVSFIILAGLFAMYGLFKAFVDASQRAFISDLSEVEIRGTALGTFETFTGLAAIPAGLIAGALWNVNPVYTFTYGLGLSLIAAIVLLVATSK